MTTSSGFGPDDVTVYSHKTEDGTIWDWACECGRTGLGFTTAERAHTIARQHGHEHLPRFGPEPLVIQPSRLARAGSVLWAWLLGILLLLAFIVVAVLSGGGGAGAGR